jgi:Flp pilus assembly pilin Flp
MPGPVPTSSRVKTTSLTIELVVGEVRFTPDGYDMTMRRVCGVRSRFHGSESGQALAQYALVLGLVALLAAAAIFLSGAISKNYGSVSNEFSHPTTPHPVTPPVSWPTSIEQCQDNGWRNFPQFDDQTACEQYVTDG